MSTDRSRLDGVARRRALAAMAETTFDVVVVGGGVTGAGVALDAAGRGLSVALLEARDLASGTSSRSGKLFHGGLRYLEQLNFSLVREALRERDLMVARLCPHLVEPEPFLIPFTKHRQRPYVGSGVLLYDLLRLTGSRSVRGHRHLGRKRALEEMPALRPDITGAVQYFDVRVDDARHTMTLARTAAAYGALIVTRAEVVGLRLDGARVVGVRVDDTEGGTEFEVRARAVVNAAGVWVERVQRMAGPPSLSVTPAKGIHLLVPGDRIAARTGMVARASDSVVIVRKWFDHWLIGTTDTAWEHDLDDPAVSRADVDYLLGQVNRWLRRPLSWTDDVVGSYAGLRPLVSGKGATTSAFSRDHVVHEDPAGLFTIAGGKYTTYRLMAKDAVDAVAATLARSVPPCCTDRLPLVGADGVHALRNGRARLAAEAGIDAAWVDHLLGRYGSTTTALLDLVADEPALGVPVPGAPGYLAAEFVHAARNEGALRLADLLVRRTRVFMETGDGGRAAAPAVAELVADELGWSDRRRHAEVAEYLEEVDADRQAAAAPDDGAAVRARAGARASRAPDGGSDR